MNSSYLICWKDFNLGLPVLPEKTHQVDNLRLLHQTERVDIISNPRPGERRQLNLLGGELRHVKGLAQHLGFNWFNVSLCLSSVHHQQVLLNVA